MSLRPNPRVEAVNLRRQNRELRRKRDKLRADLECFLSELASKGLTTEADTLRCILKYDDSEEM